MNSKVNNPLINSDNTLIIHIYYIFHITFINIFLYLTKLTNF